MKSLTLLGGLSASLLLTGALSAQAPFNPTPRTGNTVYQPTTAAGGGVLNLATTETFQAYSLPAGGAENLNITYLDENAIANGQGPGLVLDGCIYACNQNTLQWNDAGYYGQPSRDILANSGDGLLVMKYDVAVQSMSLTLHAFDGYGDSTTINVYDSNGALIHTSAGIAVPSSAPVPFSFSAADIRSLTIQSNVWPWSTIIDNHVFGGAGGPTLTKQGNCPGPMSLRVTGATANAPIAILYGQAGSYTRPNGLCAGTTIGISNPSLAVVINTNGQGAAGLNFNAPPALCGRTVQGVDLAACAPTNTITL
jgi:hypothetical protein